MDFLTSLFETVGPVMFLGLIGLYLIVSAIVGQIIPRNIRITSLGQRKLLGAVGALLFAPALISIYVEFFTTFSPSTFTPSIEEQVIEHEDTPPDTVSAKQDEKISQFALYRGANTFFANPFTGNAQSDDKNWRVVESFGLAQNNIRRLKHSHFDKEVFVYVDDIHYNKSFDLYVFISDRTGWPDSGEVKKAAFSRRIAGIEAAKKFRLNIVRSGDTIEFRHKGRIYLLRVKRIYAVLFGMDKIVVEICEKAGKKKK